MKKGHVHRTSTQARSVPAAPSCLLRLVLPPTHAALPILFP